MWIKNENGYSKGGIIITKTANRWTMHHETSGLHFGTPYKTLKVAKRVGDHIIENHGTLDFEYDDSEKMLKFRGFFVDNLADYLEWNKGV